MLPGLVTESIIGSAMVPPELVDGPGTTIVDFGVVEPGA
jgi:hypothetical protein